MYVDLTSKFLIKMHAIKRAPLAVNRAPYLSTYFYTTAESQPKTKYLFIIIIIYSLASRAFTRGLLLLLLLLRLRLLLLLRLLLRHQCKPGDFAIDELYLKQSIYSLLLSFIHLLHGRSHAACFCFCYCCVCVCFCCCVCFCVTSVNLVTSL